MRIASKHLKNMKKILMSDNADKVKDFYKLIVETKAPDLKRRIKDYKYYTETDIFDSFKNLHNSKLTAKQKEITYRLLYKITPTSAYKKQKCNICKTAVETESHLFYTCPLIQTIKLDLSKQIKDKTQATQDLYQTIFLNTTNKNTTKTDTKMITQLTAAYRQTIWNFRNIGIEQKTPIRQHILENHFSNLTKDINLSSV